jgi:hypothetical protein
MISEATRETYRCDRLFGTTHDDIACHVNKGVQPRDLKLEESILEPVRVLPVPVFTRKRRQSSNIQAWRAGDGYPVRTQANPYDGQQSSQWTCSGTLFPFVNPKDVWTPTEAEFYLDFFNTISHRTGPPQSVKYNTATFKTTLSFNLNVEEDRFLQGDNTIPGRTKLPLSRQSLLAMTRLSATSL